MQRFEADAQQFGGACLVIGGGERLQDQLALDGVHRGAQREAQGGEFGGGGGVGAAEVRRADGRGRSSSRSQTIAARSRTLRSSRTLPGQV